jgi:hypothetical protein
MRIKSILFLMVMLAFASPFLFAQAGGTCAHFNGSSYMTPGNAYKYQNFTIEMWIYKDNWDVSANEAIMSCTQAGGYSIRIYERGTIDSLVFAYRNSAHNGYLSVQYGLVDVTPGWHHLAVSHTSSSAALYFDGILRDEGGGSNMVGGYDTDNYLLIGAEPGGGSTPDSVPDYFTGDLDEIRIWELHLVQEDIQQWMYIPFTAAFAPYHVSYLRGYYKFDTDIDWLDDASNNVGGSAETDLANHGCSLSNLNTPLSNTPPDYFWQPRILASKDGTEWSEDSYGMSLCVSGSEPLGTTEFDGFSCNGVQGSEATDIPDSVYRRASNIWYVDFAASDSVSFRFDIAAFAPDLLVSGALPEGYALLRRNGESGEFEVLAPVDEVVGGCACFYDFTAVDDAYFTLGLSYPQCENLAGSCLDLIYDPAVQYISLGAPEALKLEQFTLATWFMRTGTGQSVSTGDGGIIAIPLLTKGRGEADGDNRDLNYFLGIDASSDVLAADFEDMSSGTNHPVYGTTSIDNNVWYHAAASYDGTTWRLYLNGELETEQTANATPRYDSIMPNAFGSAVNSIGVCSGCFVGCLDETSIWNTALSAEEIRTRMYRSLEGFETGLAGYWQFNEATGSFVYDHVGGNPGSFVHMDEDNWIVSTAPFAAASVGYCAEAAGSLVFGDTGVSMYFNQAGTSDICVAGFDRAPNLAPPYVQALDSRHWIVNRYGSGSFNADVTFGLDDDLTPEDLGNLPSIKLFSRPGHSRGAWEYVASASSLDPILDTATFSGITGFCQFLVCRDTNPVITVADRVDFEPVNIALTQTVPLWVKNTGTGNLSVSGITIDNPEFSVDMTSFTIAPGDSCQIGISYDPPSVGSSAGILTISSNDPFNPIREITLHGVGVAVEIALYDPFHFVPAISMNIDVGSTSAPCLADLDGDYLYDLIVGEQNGNLNRYEQDAVNSDSFTLVSGSFNGIDTGYYSYPFIIDLDGDGLLDMLIGEQNGTIMHYEQVEEYSASFSLVDEDFNNIDVGFHAAPVVADLDGNGLLDMLVGTYNGNICHYAQQTADSYQYAIVSSNFNVIDVGSCSVPTLADLDDGDGWDMMVGSNDGKLHYYAQDDPNATAFTKLNASFNGIDVGYEAYPVVMDIDHDALLDLVIGCEAGTLQHFEQVGIGSVDFGQVLVNHPVVKHTHIRANNLLGEINVNCAAGYGVSLAEDGPFAQNCALTPDDGTVSSVIYIRFEPAAEVDYPGNITFSTSGSDPIELSVSGSGASYSAVNAGQALELDGSNDYVDLGNSTALKQAEDLTVMLWAYMDDWTTGSNARLLSNTDNGGYSIYLNASGSIVVDTYHNDGYDSLTSDAVLSPGWHHIAFTFDGQRSSSYLDGSLGASLTEATSSTIVYNPLNHTLLGAEVSSDSLATGNYFHGKVDEISIWNAALDSLQIREQMHLNLTGNEAGLVSYWQCNSTSGSILVDLVGANQGKLRNMNDLDWITSTVPLGTGFSCSETEALGSLDFTGTGLALDFTLAGEAELTVTRIDATPNLIPDLNGDILDSEYWVVDRFGGGEFDSGITFSSADTLYASDQQYPSRIYLYHREANSDEDWNYMKAASFVDAANREISFTGITGFGQFLLARNSVPVVETGSSSLFLGRVLLSETAHDTLWVYNQGGDTLLVSNIIIDNAEFWTDTSLLELVPGDSARVVVSFSPQGMGSREGIMTLYSNDPVSGEIEIPVSGYACFNDDVPGTALHFDGTGSYVDLNEPEDLKLSVFTLMAWFKRLGNGATTTTGAGGLILEPLITKGRGESDGNNRDMNYFLGIEPATGVLAADFEDMATGGNHCVEGVTLIQDNVWYHAAATYDGTTWRLYLNGNLEVESIENATPRYDSIQDNAIGSALTSSGVPAGYFLGLIDEVSIWNVALNAQQVREMAYLQKCGCDESCKAYYQFNEGSGTILRDHSSSNDGTLMGMTEANWMASSIPFGPGYADSQLLSSAGTYTFTDTGLQLTLADPLIGEPVTVCELETEPNLLPGDVVQVFDDRYWVVNSYGGESYACELSFSDIYGIVPADAVAPYRIKLYTRANNSDGSWTLSHSASEVQIDGFGNMVTFGNVSSFGQFILCRGEDLLESPQNVVIESDGINLALTWEEVDGAASYKIYASDTPEGIYEDVTDEGIIARGQPDPGGIPGGDAGGRPVRGTMPAFLPRTDHRPSLTWTAPISAGWKFFRIVASTDATGRLFSPGRR